MGTEAGHMRYDRPYSIIRRADSQYYYLKLFRWNQYQSTHTTSTDFDCSAAW